MYSGGSLEVVENFCYLRHMLSSEGGVERSVITRVGTVCMYVCRFMSFITTII